LGTVIKGGESKKPGINPRRVHKGEGCRSAVYIIKNRLGRKRNRFNQGLEEDTDP